MDFVLLKDFLITYSLPTVIIAVAVAVVTVITDKIFKDKIPLFIKNYLPFILAIVIYIVYDMFVKGCFALSEDAVCAGILSGSLSTVICSAIRKIGRGESIGISATVLLIESLISGYIAEENLSATALSLDSVITESSDADNIAERIIKVLKDNSVKATPDDELKSVAALIIQSVKAIKKE